MADFKLPNGDARSTRGWEEMCTADWTQDTSGVKAPMPRKQARNFYRVKTTSSGEESLIHRNDDGITTISIYDFLLNPNSLEL